MRIAERKKKIINWWKIVMLIAIIVTFREQAINWALFTGELQLASLFNLDFLFCQQLLA
jgi:hypothetical protein